MGISKLEIPISRIGFFENMLDIFPRLAWNPSTVILRVRIAIFLSFLFTLFSPTSHLIRNPDAFGVYVFKGVFFFVFVFHLVLKYLNPLLTVFFILFFSRISLKNLFWLLTTVSFIAFICMGLCTWCIHFCRIPTSSPKQINVGDILDTTAFHYHTSRMLSKNEFADILGKLISLENEYNSHVAKNGTLITGDSPENAFLFLKSFWEISFIFQDFAFYFLFLFFQWAFIYFLLKTYFKKKGDPPLATQPLNYAGFFDS